MALADYDGIATEWAEGLAGLTGDEIRDGIHAARKAGPWPPSIAEFRSFATAGANAEQRAFAARSEPAVPMLASGTWEDRKKVAAGHLQALMASLRDHHDGTEA